MNERTTVILLYSSAGRIALTVDELRAAQERAVELMPASLPQSAYDTGSASNECELLDAAGAASVFGVKASWLLQRARENRLPHYRVGKYVRFDIAELQKYLRKNESTN